MSANTTQPLRPFGVGPLVVGPALVWLATSWVAGRCMPGLAEGFPSDIGCWIGSALVGVGVILYVTAMRQFRKAIRGELVTTGLYGWCRHPFYAIWIFLLLPGIGGLVGNWVGLAAPFIAWLLFRVLIRREETDLETRFGEAYRDYAARVGRLWPRKGFKGRIPA